MYSSSYGYLRSFEYFLGSFFLKYKNENMIISQEDQNQELIEYLISLNREVRTILNGIVGLSSLMGNASLSEQEKSELPGQIIQLTFQLNKILDFSIKKIIHETSMQELIKKSQN
jgi:hypothetical protein